MSPRVALPGADELFRATAPPSAAGAPAPSPAGAPDRVDPPASGGDDHGDTRGTAAAERAGGTSGPARSTASSRRRPAARGTTGRERHEEKITVYVSASELVELERARLTLRAEHGIAVDRGRIVREALSVLLADLDAKAADSILVRRLTGS